MSNIFKLIATSFIVVLIVACGSSAKEEKGGLADKKQELAKLKTDQTAVNDKVRKLEDEIGKLDSSTLVRPKLVAITALSTENFTHYIDLQGKIDAENISYIAPRGAPGQVRALYIKEGDNVRKGQLILKIDDALARQGVASARQGIEGIKTQLALARDLYRRQQNLWTQGIGTEVQLLNAKTNVEALENQVKQGEEGVKLAQEQLNQTSVYSDVSGVADVVNIKVGELFQGATAQGPQISIVNTSALKAVVDVPENYIGSVKRGTPVVIEVQGPTKTIKATISRVAQQINANSRGLIAEANIPRDAALRPNQLIIMKIQDYAVKNTMVIPMTTIQTDEKGKYVFVLETEKGKQIARKRPVEIGQIYGEKIEIRAGLKEGEQLISQGYQSIYDGQTVTTQG
ncbi:MAG: efflux RND transporter periplasmic adaptor subunit [Chitinophagaceae bacterium]|nr:efflux RND transporter periplasmic adaptor subunit [Chitinophagaceae bacterium]